MFAGLVQHTESQAEGQGCRMLVVPQPGEGAAARPGLDPGPGADCYGTNCNFDFPKLKPHMCYS